MIHQFPDQWPINQQRFQVCAELDSAEARNRCEEANAPMTLIAGLVAIPVALSECGNALQAKTWKTCALHTAAAVGTAVMGAVFIATSTATMDRHKSS